MAGLGEVKGPIGVALVTKGALDPALLTATIETVYAVPLRRPEKTHLGDADERVLLPGLIVARNVVGIPPGPFDQLADNVLSPGVITTDTTLPGLLTGPAVATESGEQIIETNKVTTINHSAREFLITTSPR